MQASLSLPITHVNWLGLWTLYKKEVWRFIKVWNQTLIAPVINVLLFLAIFKLALGGNGHQPVVGMAFDRFIAPGLLAMAVVQNAFANSSSSLMLAKIQGVIVDLLMPPLSAGEIAFAFMMGGITRGLLVGVAVYVSLIPFVPMEIAHPLLLLYFVLMSSAMLALCGLLTGLWSQSFDQLAAITNYIVAPLSFLSGTFYAISSLPPVWLTISQFNPFFYMIDGIRYAMTNTACGDVAMGMSVLLVVNGMLWLACVKLLKSGYRLKS
jgi:ABC-2 type transport system permease protein